MNKSLVTNIVASLLVVLGLCWSQPWQSQVLHTGLFALSGAVTNWLAIHMLFERVPGLYGSGIIPLHFDEFRQAIRQLLMEQFFSQDNLQRFVSQLGSTPASSEGRSGLDTVIDGIDMNAAFEKLVDAIMASSLGNMLGMFGGRDALESLRPTFVERMREFMSETLQDSSVVAGWQAASAGIMRDSVEQIVEQRLDELTPEMVKHIIQEMIRQHLGWLVVWGGVFGGGIGLISSLLLGA